MRGRRGTWTAERRLDGVRAALAAHGLTLPERYLVDGDYVESVAFEGCTALLRAPERPTAIVAANNATAAGTWRAIRAAGLACPEDVSLVSIDDLPGGSLIEPRLTHVAQPLAAMCAAAVDALVDALEGVPGQGEAVREMTADVTLGGTAGAPHGSAESIASRRG